MLNQDYITVWAPQKEMSTLNQGLIYWKTSLAPVVSSGSMVKVELQHFNDKISSIISSIKNGFSWVWWQAKMLGCDVICMQQWKLTREYWLWWGRERFLGIRGGSEKGKNITKSSVHKVLPYILYFVMFFPFSTPLQYQGDAFSLTILVLFSQF